MKKSIPKKLRSEIHQKTMINTPSAVLCVPFLRALCVKMDSALTTLDEPLLTSKS